MIATLGNLIIPVIFVNYVASETYKLTQRAFDTNFSSTRYDLKNSISRSLYDNPCMGDCVNYTCVVNAFGELEICVTAVDTVRIRHPAAGVLQRDVKYCRGSCVNDTNAPWCIVDTSGSFDLCGPFDAGSKVDSLAYEFLEDRVSFTGRSYGCESGCERTTAPCRVGGTSLPVLCSPIAFVLPPTTPTLKRRTKRNAFVDCFSRNTLLGNNVSSSFIKYLDMFNAEWIDYNVRGHQDDDRIRTIHYGHPYCRR
ncbi:28.2 kDa [Spodoptera frugiperda ascovirus 1a]|uniref:Uncharacterized protein ORF11 n=1 Tax=Spodoptera frugiperda ascovirus 1a TaxID=113370 RepID=Y011_SFAVA|nr:28.2 kDa [Spodoptera frugiperda ascovirus 1a]Q0E590.1 RecName: Full=Uncharacterized protein ORF11; Flags: Precursor [Spodoptera frugiperda ascovirus 1a]CAL44611.1 28.2 kDa [Spodoptera frugiperda ascovirus 1a]